MVEANQSCLGYPGECCPGPGPIGAPGRAQPLIQPGGGLLPGGLGFCEGDEQLPAGMARCVGGTQAPSPFVIVPSGHPVGLFGKKTLPTTQMDPENTALSEISPPQKNECSGVPLP